MRRQALCAVLSDRVRGERLSVLKGLKVEAPKTKPFAEMILPDAIGHHARGQWIA